MLNVPTIHADRCHLGWDNSISPVAHVAPGDTLAFDLNDSSGGQIQQGSTAVDVLALNFDRVNPVTGPVYVEGARPGDTLVVHIDAFEPRTSWGWTAIIPGFGLLENDFPDPALHTWRWGPGDEVSMLDGWATVPLRPFAGTIGVAPAEAGTHSVVPPRRVGGNMDTRDLCAGSVLYLPIEVDGALLSIGDGHAAQGDGEVCGTAIETSLTASVKVDLVKGHAPRTPVFETPGAPPQKGTFLATTGISGDLMIAARDAVRSMIDELERRVQMPPHTAYMLISVAADLRIVEIVDRPNWVVACYLNRSVFMA